MDKFVPLRVKEQHAEYQNSIVTIPYIQKQAGRR